MNIICTMYNVLKYTQLFFLLATHTHFGKRIVSIELRLKLLGSNVFNYLKISTANLQKRGSKNEGVTFQRT